MDQKFLLLAVLLPIAAGVLMSVLRVRSEHAVRIYTGAVTLAVSCLAWALIICCPQQPLVMMHFTDNLALTLCFDGLGRFFAGIIATLWPLTVLYAFEYMKNDEHQPAFFTYFTMAYGVTLGIAMSGNIFTMYCFYELLTLVTVPLVMHPMTRQAVRAARTYFVFSLGGAAFAFASMLFLVVNEATDGFVFGGLLDSYPYGKPYITLVFYMLGFLGFGVKAAVFPTDKWLPKASVAPTPVTALLHAVAVVKSGVFAVIRLTYFCFGTQLLRGTWAQTAAMAFAAFTVVYGAARALKESHWKRRLAYSTVANLSYILLGVTMMTEAGLAAGLLHMAFHAEIKILAFFCAGAVLHSSGREYIRELDGLGRKMPVTFGCFTVAALALTGVPPLSGFVSKWSLLTAAADDGAPMSYVGAAALLVAALFTAMYMLTTVCRAWFPQTGTPEADVREVSWRMTVPMVILALAIVLTGIFAGRIADAAQRIACGL